MYFLIENPCFTLKTTHFYHKNPPFNRKSRIFSGKPPI
ncbi:hypothetical protein CP061683_2145 [Chlamydia psittaci 06-1683]|nr:hypothetical protein CP061683_2145 [Chlamydia psittaci 06-1683]EPP37611.1 hypothetical protein CP10743SC13_1733 [Chlamydia psittaci 10_743_SC13]